MRRTWKTGLAAALLSAAFTIGTMPAIASAQAAATAAAASPRLFVTDHEGRFGGETLRYRATVEEMVVTAAEGAASASLFTISYVRSDVADAAGRPVIFLFNGGPGSPSMLLHMGAFGPKRVALPADPAVPITGDEPLVDNPATPLDVADLVFIDPPGTGYGRIGPNSGNAFYNAEADAAAVSDVIRRWLAARGRQSSPAYILGESYGAIRAAIVARNLAATPEATRLGGIVLVGQSLNLIETMQRPANIVGYMAALPTLAAIAWYHERIPRNGRTLDQLLEETRTVARTEYLPALAEGAFIAPGRRDRIAARLEGLTGIPAAFYVENGLAISKERFRIELLKDRNQVVGRYDARYVGPRGTGPEGRDIDPSTAVYRPYYARLMDYLRDDLGVTLAETYQERDPGLAGVSWDYGGGASPFTDFPHAGIVADLLRKDPARRLLLISGYYDTTTTIGAAEYMLARAYMPPSQVELRQYVGGHAVYTDPDTQRRVADDVRALVRRGE